MFHPFEFACGIVMDPKSVLNYSGSYLPPYMTFAGMCRSLSLPDIKNAAPKRGVVNTNPSNRSRGRGNNSTRGRGRNAQRVPSPDLYRSNKTPVEYPTNVSPSFPPAGYQPCPYPLLTPMLKHQQNGGLPTVPHVGWVPQPIYFKDFARYVKLTDSLRSKPDDSENQGIPVGISSANERENQLGNDHVAPLMFGNRNDAHLVASPSPAVKITQQNEMNSLGNQKIKVKKSIESGTQLQNEHEPPLLIPGAPLTPPADNAPSLNNSLATNDRSLFNSPSRPISNESENVMSMSDAAPLIFGCRKNSLMVTSLPPLNKLVDHIETNNKAKLVEWGAKRRMGQELTDPIYQVPPTPPADNISDNVRFSPQISQNQGISLDNTLDIYDPMLLHYTDGAESNESGNKLGDGTLSNVGSPNKTHLVVSPGAINKLFEKVANNTLSVTVSTSKDDNRAIALDLRKISSIEIIAPAEKPARSRKTSRPIKTVRTPKALRHTIHLSHSLPILKNNASDCPSSLSKDMNDEEDTVPFNTAAECDQLATKCAVPSSTNTPSTATSDILKATSEYGVFSSDTDLPYNFRTPCLQPRRENMNSRLTRAYRRYWYKKLVSAARLYRKPKNRQKNSSFPSSMKTLRTVKTDSVEPCVSPVNNNISQDGISNGSVDMVKPASSTAVSPESGPFCGYLDNAHSQSVNDDKVLEMESCGQLEETSDQLTRNEPSLDSGEQDDCIGKYEISCRDTKGAEKIAHCMSPVTGNIPQDHASNANISIAPDVVKPSSSTAISPDPGPCFGNFDDDQSQSNSGKVLEVESCGVLGTNSHHVTGNDSSLTSEEQNDNIGKEEFCCPEPKSSESIAHCAPVIDNICQDRTSNTNISIAPQVVKPSSSTAISPEPGPYYGNFDDDQSLSANDNKVLEVESCGQLDETSDQLTRKEPCVKRGKQMDIIGKEEICCRDAKNAETFAHCMSPVTGNIPQDHTSNANISIGPDAVKPSSSTALSPDPGPCFGNFDDGQSESVNTGKGLKVEICVVLETNSRHVTRNESSQTSEKLNDNIGEEKISGRDLKTTEDIDHGTSPVNSDIFQDRTSNANISIAPDVVESSSPKPSPYFGNFDDSQSELANTGKVLEVGSCEERNAVKDKVSCQDDKSTGDSDSVEHLTSITTHKNKLILKQGTAPSNQSFSDRMCRFRGHKNRGERRANGCFVVNNELKVNEAKKLAQAYAIHHPHVLMKRTAPEPKLRKNYKNLSVARRRCRTSMSIVRRPANSVTQVAVVRETSHSIAEDAGPATSIQIKDRKSTIPTQIKSKNKDKIREIMKQKITKENTNKWTRVKSRKSLKNIDKVKGKFQDKGKVNVSKEIDNIVQLKVKGVKKPIAERSNCSDLLEFSPCLTNHYNPINDDCIAYGYHHRKSFDLDLIKEKAAHGDLISQWFMAQMVSLTYEYCDPIENLNYIHMVNESSNGRQTVSCKLNANVNQTNGSNSELKSQLWRIANYGETLHSGDIINYSLKQRIENRERKLVDVDGSIFAGNRKNARYVSDRSHKFLDIMYPLFYPSSPKHTDTYACKYRNREITEEDSAVNNQLIQESAIQEDEGLPENINSFIEDQLNKVFDNELQTDSCFYAKNYNLNGERADVEECCAFFLTTNELALRHTDGNVFSENQTDDNVADYLRTVDNNQGYFKEAIYDHIGSIATKYCFQNVVDADNSCESTESELLTCLNTDDDDSESNIEEVLRDIALIGEGHAYNVVPLDKECESGKSYTTVSNTIQKEESILHTEMKCMFINKCEPLKVDVTHCENINPIIQESIADKESYSSLHVQGTYEEVQLQSLFIISISSDKRNRTPSNAQNKEIATSNYKENLSSIVNYDFPSDPLERRSLCDEKSERSDEVKKQSTDVYDFTPLCLERVSFPSIGTTPLSSCNVIADNVAEEEEISPSVRNEIPEIYDVINLSSSHIESSGRTVETTKSSTVNYDLPSNRLEEESSPSIEATPTISCSVITENVVENPEKQITANVVEDDKLSPSAGNETHQNDIDGNLSSSQTENSERTDEATKSSTVNYDSPANSLEIVSSPSIEAQPSMSCSAITANVVEDDELSPSAGDEIVQNDIDVNLSSSPTENSWRTDEATKPSTVNYDFNRLEVVSSPSIEATPTISCSVIIENVVENPEKQITANVVDDDKLSPSVGNEILQNDFDVNSSSSHDENSERTDESTESSAVNYDLFSNSLEIEFSLSIKTTPLTSCNVITANVVEDDKLSPSAGSEFPQNVIDVNLSSSHTENSRRIDDAIKPSTANCELPLNGIERVSSSSIKTTLSKSCTIITANSVEDLEISSSRRNEIRQNDIDVNSPLPHNENGETLPSGGIIDDLLKHVIGNRKRKIDVVNDSIVVENGKKPCYDSDGSQNVENLIYALHHASLSEQTDACEQQNSEIMLEGSTVNNQLMQESAIQEDELLTENINSKQQNMQEGSSVNNQLMQESAMQDEVLSENNNQINRNLVCDNESASKDGPNSCSLLATPSTTCNVIPAAHTDEHACKQQSSEIVQEGSAVNNQLIQESAIQEDELLTENINSKQQNMQEGSAVSNQSPDDINSSVEDQKNRNLLCDNESVTEDGPDSCSLHDMPSTTCNVIPVDLVEEQEIRSLKNDIPQTVDKNHSEISGEVIKSSNFMYNFKEVSSSIQKFKADLKSIAHNGHNPFSFGIENYSLNLKLRKRRKLNIDYEDIENIPPNPSGRCRQIIEAVRPSFSACPINRDLRSISASAFNAKRVILSNQLTIDRRATVEVELFEKALLGNGGLVVNRTNSRFYSNKRLVLSISDIGNRIVPQDAQITTRRRRVVDDPPESIEPLRIKRVRKQLEETHVYPIQNDERSRHKDMKETSCKKSARLEAKSVSRREHDRQLEAPNDEDLLRKRKAEALAAHLNNRKRPAFLLDNNVNDGKVKRPRPNNSIDRTETNATGYSEFFLSTMCIMRKVAVSFRVRNIPNVRKSVHFKHSSYRQKSSSNRISRK